MVKLMPGFCRNALSGHHWALRINIFDGLHAQLQNPKQIKTVKTLFLLKKHVNCHSKSNIDHSAKSAGILLTPEDI